MNAEYQKPKRLFRAYYHGIAITIAMESEALAWQWAHTLIARRYRTKAQRDTALQYVTVKEVLGHANKETL